MRTAELSVVPESFVCNANCPFCISKQNPDPSTKARISMRALNRAVQFAKDCGAQIAIITGKGEPTMMNDQFIHTVVERLGRDFGRIDLHTNGLRFATNDYEDTESYLEMLQADGLTNLTVSISDPHEEPHAKSLGIPCPYQNPALSTLIHRLSDYRNTHPIHIRWACVLAEPWVSTPERIDEYLQFATDWGADSVIFRELWRSEGTPQGEWCKENFVPIRVFDQWRSAYEFRSNIKQLLTQPWGVTVECTVGHKRPIAVTGGVCDFHEGDFVKSLILLPDNHLYYLWGSPAAKVW